ncbi:hypothetical protein AVEN_170760-1 [Araneus ventricosus]|uniref:Uncharacterized protein n=1 Tax=Araneus ventricosus TaxID=182803 RepID=A0A4Y2UE85_ARAVE|nr:hypothetical protein AVEN_170760-1 [Araneus ventricosus]
MPQLEDPAIRPIQEKKLNSDDRPSWQEIAPETPATKRYWALWDSLHLEDGVLYRLKPDLTVDPSWLLARKSYVGSQMSSRSFGEEVWKWVTAQVSSS